MAFGSGVERRTSSGTDRIGVEDLGMGGGVRLERAGTYLLENGHLASLGELHDTLSKLEL